MAGQKTRDETTPPDAESRAVDAALRLAAARGWRRVGLGDIAEEADFSLAGLHAVARSKSALLRVFLRRIDAATLAASPTGADESSRRDRLFAVTMARLDALGPYRDGVAAIARAARCDPATAVALAVAQQRSLTWMLEAAGAPTGGFAGAVRMKGFALILASTLRTWLRDTSEDLGPTMAHLDRQLRRAEWLANLMRAPGREPAPDATA